MAQRKALACLTLLSAALGGCQSLGNSPTFAGPARMVGVQGVYGVDRDIATCDGATLATEQRLNIVTNFIINACLSSVEPENPALARRMIDAGVTLNRIRCADFFRERGANQTGERVIRRSIAPISALITGILGIVDFSTESGRQEATQILAVSSAAIDGALSVYENEFLFGASNIRSVELLTMQDIDVHGTAILNRNSNFYQGLRDLLDHQAKCRPTHILQLAQDAIENSRIHTPQNTAARAAAAEIAGDQRVIEDLRIALAQPTLSDDQIGVLWWMVQPSDANAPLDLAIVKARLGQQLSAMFVASSDNGHTLSPAWARVRDQVSARIDRLSNDVKANFQLQLLALLEAKGRNEPPDLLERTRTIMFALPPDRRPVAQGEVRTSVGPATSQ